MVFLLPGWDGRLTVAAAAQVSVLSFVGWLLLSTPVDAIKLKPGLSVWMVTALSAWAGWCYAGPFGSAGAGAAAWLGGQVLLKRGGRSPWWAVLWTAHPISAVFAALPAATMFGRWAIAGWLLSAIGALVAAGTGNASGIGRLARPMWLFASMLAVLAMRS